MSGHDFDEEAPHPSRYAPSGWFNPLTMLPLLVPAIATALAMAFVLCLLEANFYYYFLTPLVVGVPVLGAVWGVVRLGHCRSPLVGSLVGLALAAFYYLGFWQLSYQVNVVSQGPGAVMLVRMLGGAPGLPGYFNFRCMTSKPIAHHGAPPGRMRAPDKADRIFNYIFFGGEALTIAVIGIAIGRGQARRVYYEGPRRWSSKAEFRLPPATLGTVLRAIEAQDWTTIAALPRIASGGGNANSTSLLFRVEYLPGAADESSYLSLSGTNLGKAPLLDADGQPIPIPGGGAARTRAARETVARWFLPKPMLRCRAFLDQVAIEPESARELARHFPDIKLGPPATSPVPVFDPFDGHRDAPDRTIGAKKGTSKPDFREKAVNATCNLLDEEDQARPWEVDASCCLPTGDGRRAVRSAAWWKIKALFLTIFLFFGGLVLAAWASEVKDRAGNQPPVARALMLGGGIVAVVDAVLMLGVIFGADVLQKRLLKRRLGRREGSLLDASAHLPARLLRLEDAQTYHVQKLAPEDLCVCIFDRPNRRVLLEGVSHRYIIRDVDVTNFWPLQSGEKVSLRIDYQIGDETLALVLATENPLAHVFHGVFAHRALKGLVRRFVETFGREFPDSGQRVPQVNPA